MQQQHRTSSMEEKEGFKMPGPTAHSEKLNNDDSSDVSSTPTLTIRHRRRRKPRQIGGDCDGELGDVFEKVGIDDEEYYPRGVAPKTQSKKQYQPVNRPPTPSPKNLGINKPSRNEGRKYQGQLGQIQEYRGAQQSQDHQTGRTNVGLLRQGSGKFGTAGLPAAASPSYPARVPKISIQPPEAGRPRSTVTQKSAQPESPPSNRLDDWLNTQTVSGPWTPPRATTAVNPGDNRERRHKHIRQIQSETDSNVQVLNGYLTQLDKAIEDDW